MSSTSILTQILKKAHTGGYRCKSANSAYNNFSVIDFDVATEQFSLKLTSPATTSVFHSSLSVLVNDSSFLKAYFGHQYDCHGTLGTTRGNKLSYLAMELEQPVTGPVMKLQSELQN